MTDDLKTAEDLIVALGRGYLDSPDEDDEIQSIPHTDTLHKALRNYIAELVESGDWYVPSPGASPKRKKVFKNMPSVPSRAAYKVAQEKDYKFTLDNTDGKFNLWTRVTMRDGSSFTIANAFCKKYDDGKQKWLFIFPEHYAFMVLDFDEVKFYCMFERKHDLEEEEE